MKHVFAFLLIVILSYNAFSQGWSNPPKTYNVNVTYKNSSPFGEINPYEPDWAFMERVMSQSQSSYTATKKLAQDNWNDILLYAEFLRGMELHNQYNIEILETHKEKVFKNLDDWRKWDLTNSVNVNNIIDYIIWPWVEVKSIKEEMSLIRELNKELKRISEADPDNYIYSKRYKSIKATYDALKSCSRSEIESLSWQDTELNMSDYSNQNSSTSLNKSREQALESANQQIYQHPEDATSYYFKGNLLYESKDYYGAINNFDMAIKLNPNFAQAFYGRGLAKIALGMKTEGCVDLSTAGRIGYREAHNAIKTKCN